MIEALQNSCGTLGIVAYVVSDVFLVVDGFFYKVRDFIEFYVYSCVYTLIKFFRIVVYNSKHGIIIFSGSPFFDSIDLLLPYFLSKNLFVLTLDLSLEWSGDHLKLFIKDTFLPISSPDGKSSTDISCSEYVLGSLVKCDVVGSNLNILGQPDHERLLPVDLKAHVNPPFFHEDCFVHFIKLIENHNSFLFSSRLQLIKQCFHEFSIEEITPCVKRVLVYIFQIWERTEQISVRKEKISE